MNAFVSVKLATHSDEALAAFERAIGACPEVMEMYEMTGARDYLMRVVAADLATFETFLRRWSCGFQACSRWSWRWR